jgi:ribosomal protein L1
VAVTQVLGVGIVRARYCGRARRDDHVRRRVVLPSGGGPVDRLAVLGAIRDHARDAALRLPEQDRRPDRVIPRCHPSAHAR